MLIIFFWIIWTNFSIIFAWNQILNDLYKHDDKLELIPWHVLWLPMIGLKFPKKCQYFHVKIWKNSYVSFHISVTSLWQPLVASWTMKKPGGNTWEEKSWDSFSKKVELFSIMRDRIKKISWKQNRNTERTGHTLPPLA